MSEFAMAGPMMEILARHTEIVRQADADLGK